MEPRATEVPCGLSTKPRAGCDCGHDWGTAGSLAPLLPQRACCHGPFNLYYGSRARPRGALVMQYKVLIINILRGHCRRLTAHWRLLLAFKSELSAPRCLFLFRGELRSFIGANFTAASLLAPVRWLVNAAAAAAAAQLLTFVLVPQFPFWQQAYA